MFDREKFSFSNSLHIAVFDPSKSEHTARPKRNLSARILHFSTSQSRVFRLHFYGKLLGFFSILYENLALSKKAFFMDYI